MKAVVCVANIAGRVGKTMTAIHVAAELALRGFETLLIDADPQAEATAHLIDPEGVRLSVADLMLAPVSPRRAHAEGLCLELEDMLVPTAVPRLRLAPSSIRLTAAEGDTAQPSRPELATQVNRASL